MHKEKVRTQHIVRLDRTIGHYGDIALLLHDKPAYQVVHPLPISRGATGNKTATVSTITSLY